MKESVNDSPPETPWRTVVSKSPHRGWLGDNETLTGSTGRFALDRYSTGAVYLYIFTGRLISRRKLPAQVKIRNPRRIVIAVS